MFDAFKFWLKSDKDYQTLHTRAFRLFWTPLDWKW